jgi:cytochrome c oxidase subunit II
VELVLRSADVIHSFWVPNLAGKVDMIPGRTTRLQLAAERPGVYRGQCAEFCGGPHAKMAFYVIAEAPEQFAAWLENQRKPAQKSHSLFASRCAVCHTVRGTEARGVRGPDLTHLASRGSLGAATLPMNAGTLAAWIVSGQHHKPGNLMPEFKEFTPQELKALAAYLESLK